MEQKKGVRCSLMHCLCRAYFFGFTIGRSRLSIIVDLRSRSSRYDRAILEKLSSCNDCCWVIFCSVLLHHCHASSFARSRLTAPSALVRYGLRGVFRNG